MSLVQRGPLRELDKASSRPPKSASTKAKSIDVKVSLSRAEDAQPFADDIVDLDPETSVDLDLAARSRVNVMVTARHGADRAALAHWIHARSSRGDDRFVAVCGHPLPGTNRAVAPLDVDGWFRRAAGGTLFIDQVGQLSPAAQAEFLSRLTDQEGHAGRAMVPAADQRVRVIAGSDRSLHADLAVGTFSDELFYRLNVIHIDQMHQRETGEDVMKARDIMSTPPYTCGPDTDLATVAMIMWEHDCGFVPVVDASGAVVGIVTDRDICIATSTRRLLPEHISASRAMTTPVHVCLSDDSIGDVLATMKRCQVRRVPVIDHNGRLQGVISLNDIVLAANDTREPKANDIVSTLAGICARRHAGTAVAHSR